jgi:hypothetical protein
MSVVKMKAYYFECDLCHAQLQSQSKMSRGDILRSHIAEHHKDLLAVLNRIDEKIFDLKEIIEEQIIKEKS